MNKEYKTLIETSSLAARSPPSAGFFVFGV